MCAFGHYAVLLDDVARLVAASFISACFIGARLIGACFVDYVDPFTDAFCTCKNLLMTIWRRSRGWRSCTKTPCMDVPCVAWTSSSIH